MSAGKTLLGKIFVSYSSTDRRFVRRLAKRLTDAGFKLWLDERELKAGDRLSESIAAALAEAKVILVVVSAASAKSKWLRYELNLATERMIKGKCRVIPALIEDCTIPNSVDGLLYADFRQSFTKGTKSLLTALIHEKNRAVKNAGFWAQSEVLIGKVFEGQGWVSRLGEFDNRTYDIVSVPTGTQNGGESTVVYDTVAAHRRPQQALSEHWWNEYTRAREDHDEDLFLVVSQRPVEVKVAKSSNPGDRIKYRTFDKPVVGHEIGHVVFADLSGVYGERGRLAILRAAKRALSDLAMSLQATASR